MDAPNFFLFLSVSVECFFFTLRKEIQFDCFCQLLFWISLWIKIPLIPPNELYGLL